MAADQNPDLSEFISYSRPVRPPCAVAAALEALKGDELAELRAALALDKNRITNAAIEKWLAARGLKVNSQRVASHRRGSCDCHD